MAKFVSSIPAPGTDPGWQGNFFDRLGAFWRENGDVFSPVTKAAFLLFVSLIVILSIRSIWLRAARRRAAAKEGGET